MKYSEEFIGKIIREERENRKWTQNKLGEKLNVSGKQVSNYERGTPIPPIDVLIKLCELFDCELGYILGEEDYSEGSKFRTAVCRETGLTTASVEAIHKITGADRSCIEFGRESEKYKRILNSLFSSQRLFTFIESIGDLDDCIAAFNNVDKKLVARLGKDLFDEALNYYNSKTDYLNSPNAETLKPELIEALKLIDASIDKQCKLRYSVKVARYELCETFESLIKDIYPMYRK